MVTADHTDPGLDSAGREKPRHIRFQRKDIGIAVAVLGIAFGALAYFIRAEIQPIGIGLENHIDVDATRDSNLKSDITKVEERLDKTDDKVDDLRNALHRIEVRQEAQNKVLPLPRHVRRSLPPVPIEEPIE